MTTIILSPHFDDAALSCGGWIADARRRGEEVVVWTICTGLPVDDDFSPLAVEYHGHWALSPGEVIDTRTKEDLAAMQLLDVPYRHFGIADGLYRKHPRTDEHLYPDEEGLLGSIHPGDADLVRLLALQLANALPGGEVILVSPLTVGNHVDHQLVRAAAENLPVPLWYYPDYPYTRKYPYAAPSLAPAGYKPEVSPVSDPALVIWQDSIAAYASQISSFWPSLDEMRAEIAQLRRENQGIVFWKPPAR
ncbi:MAG: PIG-L deacetylase family protein [Anaerolineales bacterium]